MVTVRLQVLSWLTRVFDAERRARVAWEEEVERDSTLRALFERLAREHPQFGELVYDTAEGKLTGIVSVIYNDRILELAGGLDVVVHDGDSIVLLPAFSGGSGDAGP